MPADLRPRARAVRDRAHGDAGGGRARGGVPREPRGEPGDRREPRRGRRLHQARRVLSGGARMRPQPREARTGQGPRSSGLSYQELLDTRHAAACPRCCAGSRRASCPPRACRSSATRSRAFHELEVERVWKKVWQMACREEEIPEVGDRTVYDDRGPVGRDRARGGAARSAPSTTPACTAGASSATGPGRAEQLRCPFHGWTWNLDGSLKAIPCALGLPARRARALPAARGCGSARWGGFVFVNLDPTCGAARSATSASCRGTSSAGRSRSATRRRTSRRCCRATGRWRRRPSWRPTT